MGACMEIEIEMEIDDVLLQQAKEEAAKRGLSVDALIELGLRAVLDAEPPEPPASRNEDDDE